MNEQERILDLISYQILDTSPEKYLDELADIASIVCGTPISFLSLVDVNRQWFKALKGVDFRETKRSDSFCLHALQRPKEVLVIDDPLNDERFKNNPLVIRSPNIRFYAGAPLETPMGNVLGTLCVFDDKPRTISEKQKKALQLLAGKAMDYLNTRKLLLEQDEKIEISTVRLKKLTDQALGCIYQLEMTLEGKMSFLFMSEGISELHPMLSPELLKTNPEIIFDALHPDDVQYVKESINESFKNLTHWNMEFRVINNDKSISWHWGNAKPEIQANGNVVWYGMIMNVSNRKEYEQTLEQISFDISHVLRRPVASMLGLTSIIEKDNLSEAKLKEYAGYMKVVSEEMNRFTKMLNLVYLDKKEKLMRTN